MIDYPLQVDPAIDELGLDAPVYSSRRRLLSQLTGRNATPGASTWQREGIGFDTDTPRDASIGAAPLDTAAFRVQSGGSTGDGASAQPYAADRNRGNVPVRNAQALNGGNRSAPIMPPPGEQPEPLPEPPQPGPMPPPMAQPRITQPPPGMAPAAPPPAPPSTADKFQQMAEERAKAMADRQIPQQIGNRPQDYAGDKEKTGAKVASWAQRIGMALLSATKLAPYANQIVHPKWSQEMGAYEEANKQDEAQMKALEGAARTAAYSEQTEATAEQRKQAALLAGQPSWKYNEGVGWWDEKNPAHVIPAPLGADPKFVEVDENVARRLGKSTPDADGKWRIPVEAYKEYAGAVVKPPAGYNLGPDQIRFDANNQPIAFGGPPKPPAPVAGRDFPLPDDVEKQRNRMRPVVQTGFGPVSGVPDPQPTGNAEWDTVLAKYPPQVRSMAQGFLNYDTLMPSGRMASSPPVLAALQASREADPTFDPKRYPQQQRMMVEMTSGRESRQNQAGNVLIGHLGELNDAIDALNNGDVNQLNRLGNFTAEQLGMTPIAKFKTIVNRVAPETVEAYVGSGGQMSDRLKAADDFNPNLAPQQLKGNAQEALRLLLTMTDTRFDRWKGVMGDKPFPMQGGEPLSPRSKAIRDRILGGGQPGGAPQFKRGDSVMYQGRPHKVTAVDPQTGKLTLEP